MELNLQFTLMLCILAALFVIWTIIMSGDKKSGLHPYFGHLTQRIPNYISFVRIPLAPLLLLGIILSHSPAWRLVFHLTFWLVTIFDMLDGMFARKWNAISADGKFLDPLADKAVSFVLAVTAWLYAGLPSWAVIIIFVREMWSTVQRKRMEKQGKETSAGFLGKVKTVIQFTVLYIYILRVMPETVLLERWSRILFSDNFMLWAAMMMCFITVLSFLPFFEDFSYLIDYQKSKPRKKAAIPNLFTVSNGLCGVTAVYYAYVLPETQDKYLVVLFWLLGAALMDSIDGPLSRKLGTSSEFGMVLDNVSDFSSFGLASALVILLSFSHYGNGYLATGIICSAYFLWSVHFRLKRFTEQKKTMSKGDDFVGMPSPAGALLAVMTISLGNALPFARVFVLVISALVVMCASDVMTSEDKYLKNKSVAKQYPVLFVIGFSSYLFTLVGIGMAWLTESLITNHFTLATATSLYLILLLYAVSGLLSGKGR